MLSKLVIISGLSGSGKSTALNAFEDLDFYAVDNLPIKLLEKFLEVIEAGTSEFNKVALVMDLRDTSFVETYPSTFRRLLQRSKNTQIVFLEASDEILVRRFSETRRKHPLSHTSVAEGIAEERKLLNDLKDLASVTIDTSSMDVHALKKRISEQFGQEGLQKMQVRLTSFGFKHGTPKNCDLVFDVRFLNNPHFVTELRDSTGLDKKVGDFIDKDERTASFLTKCLDLLEFLIPQYALEGKTYLTVGIGCTGGKHRSVYIAESLAKRLKTKLKNDYTLAVEHQDLRLQKS